MAENDPSTTSSDHKAMAPYWRMVAAIMGGIDGMRKAGEDFLPRFEAESKESYKRRLKTARMTNVFADIVGDLTLRPFQEPTQISDASTEALREFAGDVDAAGSDLNAFALKVFVNALVDGLTWVLVDYTKDVPEGASVAEERALGARPIWLHYRAADVLAIYTERVEGVERIVEARLREDSVERDGFDEKQVERVRIFRHSAEMESPEWEVWRKVPDANVVGGKWEIEEGPVALDINVIPLVPIVFGRRAGTTWVVDPPLRDAAHLQVELYQQENALKNVRTLTAFPMLAANGMDPDLGEDNKPKPIKTGPNAVLFGGGGENRGEWSFVEPAGSSLRFLREDNKDTIVELRELGRQPLVSQSNLTVVTTAAVVRKGNTAIQAWTGVLRHGLESCFAMTAKWINLEEYDIEIMVFDDFDLGFGDNADFQAVLTMGTGQEPIISREAVLQEAKRRGILGANYDPEADLKLIDRRMEDPPPGPMDE